MLIKIIPETDREKRTFKETEHSNIREFFIFGNKKDNDGELVDFHDWDGSYRFLQGSLYYFMNLITEEANAKARSSSGPEINLAPTQQAQGAPQLIKQGGEGQIDQVTDAKDLKKEFDNFPKEHHLDRKHGLKVVKTDETKPETKKEDKAEVEEVEAEVVETKKTEKTK